MYITLFLKYLVKRNEYTNQKTYLYFYVFSKGFT